MKVVVFVGPTLPVIDARQILDAIYLPPAGQGDVVSAISRHRPDVIGLIDGVFYQSLSVWHKEILYALSVGIAVYGAASMGAIRAAECGRFGMIGVGDIYRRYASGVLEDDDEVAVAHGPAESGFQPLSDALVNIRATLLSAVDRGIIRDQASKSLCARAKNTYFPDRKLDALISDPSGREIGTDEADRLRAFVRDGYVDIKRRDAIEMLRRIGDPGMPGASTAEPGRSVYFNMLRSTDRRVPADDGEIELGIVARQAAISDPSFDDMILRARSRRFATIASDLLGLEPTPDDKESVTRQFRSRLGLGNDGALADWQTANDIDDADLAAMLHSLACVRRVNRWLLFVDRGNAARDVLDEMRLANRYVNAKNDAVRVDRVARAAFPEFDQQVSEISTVELLEEQAGASGWSPPQDLDAWCRDVGFKDRDDLILALLRARLARNRLREVARSVGSLIGSHKLPGNPLPYRERDQF